MPDKSPALEEVGGKILISLTNLSEQAFVPFKCELNILKVNKCSNYYFTI